MLSTDVNNQNSVSTSMKDISMLTGDVSYADQMSTQQLSKPQTSVRQKMKLNKKNIGTVASEKETSLQLTKFSPDKVNSAVQIFHQNNMKDVKKKHLYIQAVKSTNSN